MSLDHSYRALLAFAIGIPVVLLGVRNRIHPPRRVIEASKQANAPFFIRNGAIGQVPLGLTFCVAGLALVIQDVLVATMLVFAALLLLVLGTYVMVTRPRWAQPRWMAELDVSQPTPDTRDTDRFVVLAFVAVVITGVVAFVVLVVGN